MISLCPSLITLWKLLQTILLASRDIRPSNTCLVSHSHMSRPTRLLVTICVLLEVLVVTLAKSYLVLSLTYRDTLSQARSLSQQPFESLSFFVALNGIPLLVLVSLHSAISRKSVLDNLHHWYQCQHPMFQ